MKKLLLLALLVLIYFNANAQLVLTPNGFINQNDNKNYVVFKYDGKTKQELYTATLVYLHSAYVSPKDVLSHVENEIITVNGIAPKSVKKNSGFNFDMNYTLTIRFKDGAIRVDHPTFTLASYENAANKYSILELIGSDNGSGDPLLFGIFNKQGRVNSETAKSNLERFFNNFNKALQNAILSDEVQGKW